MGARRRRAAIIAHLDYVANLLLSMLLLRVSRFVLEHISCLIIALLLLLDHVMATVAV